MSTPETEYKMSNVKAILDSRYNSNSKTEADKFKIVDIKAKEILDSRGNPTVKVKVTLADGSEGVASVPSGASTGEREAIELRDGNKDRYSGKGVLKAVDNVNTTIKDLLTKDGGMDARNQKAIDQAMIEIAGDNKKDLGANATLGVSLAVAHAAAAAKGVNLHEHIAELSGTKKGFVLPTPMMNIVNGGEHANFAIDFQEIMIMPVGAKTEADVVRMGSEVFHKLKKNLEKDGHATTVGDEGGFAPNFKNAEEALEAVNKAIKDAGYNKGGKGKEDIVLALDVASSELLDKKTNKYILGKKLPEDQQTHHTSEDMIKYYEKLVEKFPIRSIEDGLDQNDREGWKKLTAALGKKVQLVGDDLFVTDPKQIQDGINNKMANSVLIKPNQIGTLSETLEAINISKAGGYTPVISHRSGETADTTIADIAVGTNAGQIKTGSLSRADRTEKYNRLTEIEEWELKKSMYAGKEAFSVKGLADKIVDFTKNPLNMINESQGAARTV